MEQGEDTVLVGGMGTGHHRPQHVALLEIFQADMAVILPRVTHPWHVHPRHGLARRRLKFQKLFVAPIKLQFYVKRGGVQFHAITIRKTKIMENGTSIVGLTVAVTDQETGKRTIQNPHV